MDDEQCYIAELFLLVKRFWNPQTKRDTSTKRLPSIFSDVTICKTHRPRAKHVQLNSSKVWSKEFKCHKKYAAAGYE